MPIPISLNVSVPPAVGAQQGDTARTVAGGGITAPGWTGKIDPNEEKQGQTINNAKQFGLERDYGTVQIGKTANLLLLDANPLESVRAWSLIHRIVLHGNVIERESLAAK